MKFNIESELCAKACDGVKVGDVYQARGGDRSPAFWVVVARTDSSKTVKCLGIDCDGEIVSTASYYEHYFCNRPKVGFANFDDLVFDIEIWGGA